MRALLLLALLGCVLPTRQAGATMPALPAGARTHWSAGETSEIAAWVTFNPASVQGRLPSALRFITVHELAGGNVRWAADYLAAHPTHGAWGVSFLEILRAGRFTLDGRSPRWPRHGAVALWFARVAPADSATDLGFGLPYLVLEFWVPDRAYAARMRARGHYATYGDVRLYETAGHWRGRIAVSGLRVEADCVPAGAVGGGPNSAGTQVFFPPATAARDDIVRVAFAGHRTQDCAPASAWRIRGAHPLASAVVLQPSSFEYGYELEGGAYPR